MIRVLALDLGTVRVGVALSDPLGMTAQPLEVIERHRLLARVAELVTEYEVTRVIVGLPLQLDGRVGQAASSAKAVAKELQAALSVPVQLWDERMTTAAAQRVMIGAGARRDKRKQNVDKVAAALILQSYLDAQSTP
jgi:putative Holliday junction resolvase